MSDASKIIVVKVGTSTLVDDKRQVDSAYLDTLAAQVAQLRQAGWKPIIVTSAAIAAGLNALGIDERPSDIPSLQAAASVGQVVLSTAYAQALAAHDVLTSVVLLTRHDTASRSAYLHARDALSRLLELGVVPIVNENDTVSITELMFTDNDELSGLVAEMVKAEALVILTNVDGVYDGPPDDPASKIIPRILPGEDLQSKISAKKTNIGRGGMISKYQVASRLSGQGIRVIITNGNRDDILPEVLNNPAGTPHTEFVPAAVKQD